MKLARDINFGDRTANEDWTQKVSSMVENTHTAPSYSFAAYCEAIESGKRKKYFEEEFHLSECRNEIFGPDNGCECCSGTGWMPVTKSNMDEPLRSLWVQAEEDTPTEDGFHLVPCPKCNPIREELDEHIVKKGSQFELKSKKSGKNLGTYHSKSGALKRERQVEYFKHLHEHEAIGQWAPDKVPDTRPLPWRLHEDHPLPGHPPDTGFSDYVKPGHEKPAVSEDMQPSQYNKTQSQAKKDQKKAGETKKDPNAPKKDPNETEEDRKEKGKEKREEKERLRKSKKLLPYEFTDQKDAERTAGHMGIHGAHATGNGIYKPGTSDSSLRDAVAKKKAKQKTYGKLKEDVDTGVRSTVSVNDPYALDKGNCHEDRDYMHAENPKTDGERLPEMVQKIKECVIWKKL